MRMTIRACVGVVVAALAVGCSERDTTPESQQMARVNRDLAELTRTAATLEARLERLEVRVGDDRTERQGAIAAAGLHARGRAVVVTVTTAGTYAVDGSPVAETDLQAAVESRVATVGDLVIHAPADAPQERVVHVIALARAAGITAIRIVDTAADARLPAAAEEPARP